MEQMPIGAMTLMLLARGPMCMTNITISFFLFCLAKIMRQNGFQKLDKQKSRTMYSLT